MAEHEPSLRVLITRPKEDAAALAAVLRENDIDARIEPVLKVVFRPGLPLDLDNVQALLATSANGMRAFAARNSDRDRPVFAVGDATARAAAAAGFTEVESASGDVAALAELVIRRLDPIDGALLHIAAGTPAGDLGGALAAAGFRYRRELLYETVAAGRLSAETVRALRGGRVDGVVLYSPRTATIFVNLVTKAGLASACRRMIAWCLSEAVADSARALPWRRIVVAARPTQAAVIAAIVTTAASPSRP